LIPAAVVLRLGIVSVLLTTPACRAKLPPCPVVEAPQRALSAGCLTLVHGQLLVVEGWNGRVSPPGGTVEAGESAQCAAHRETWEETGLDVRPAGLLHTFATGFNLYRCDLYSDSGALDSQAITEVRRAYWLPLSDVDAVEWRFPQQGKELLALIQATEPEASSR